MRVTKYLMKYSTILTEARESSFFLQHPAIKGYFQEYDAEIGVRLYFSDSDQPVYKIFSRILLKKKFKIPLYLWSDVSVFSSKDSSCDRVSLCYGKWLTVFRGVYMPDIFYVRNIKKAIDDLDENSLKEDFKMLAEIAHKLESGEIELSEMIAKEKKEIIRVALIVIPIAVIVVGIMYWWFVRFGF